MAEKHGVKINRWDGGVTNNARDPRSNVAKMVSNFDVFQDPYKMIPYRQSEDGDSSSSTSRKQNFEIAEDLSGNYDLYSLGVVSGTSRAEILRKNDTTGASNDLDDATWETPANNQSASGTTAFGLFKYYKKTQKIYGAKGGNAIWSFDTQGGSFNDSEASITYSTVAQGMVDVSQDNLWVPYDSSIALNDNGSWTTNALTMSDDYYINSICDYNDLMAIALQPASGYGDSKVVLWDKVVRAGSVLYADAVVNWGHGNLKILDVIDGALVGVSLSGGITSRFKDRLTVRVLDGITARKVEEIIIDGNSSQLPIFKQVEDNKLFFRAYLPSFHGSERLGTWSISRTPDGRFALVNEATPNNETALTSPILHGFKYFGDFNFQAHVDNNVFKVTKTDDQANYSLSAVWESVINQGMKEQHRQLKKQLLGVRLKFDSIPSGGEIKLSYTPDQGSETEIFDITTAGETVKEADKDSNKSNFKVARDYEFKIESDGVNVSDFEYFYTLVETHV
jgi:hypothetical protein